MGTEKDSKTKEIGQKGTAQKTVKQKTVILSEINIIESVSKRQQLVVTLHLDKTGTVPQYYIKMAALFTGGLAGR